MAEWNNSTISCHIFCFVRCKTAFILRLQTKRCDISFKDAKFIAFARFAGQLPCK